MSDPVDGRTNLSEEEIIDIYLSDDFVTDLAKRYNVKRNTIWRIKNHKRHTDITGPFRLLTEWDDIINKVRTQYNYHQQKADDLRERLDALENQRAHDPSWQKQQREAEEYAEHKRKQRKEQQTPHILTLRPPPRYIPLPEEIGGYEGGEDLRQYQPDYRKEANHNEE